MRRVFFHIHIWKTAGATFLNMCRNNFGKAFHRDIMLVQEWFLSVEQLRWLLTYHNWIRFYSSHMLSGNLPYKVEDTEVFGVSLVRNPIDRFISSYHYMMGANYQGGFPKEMSFDEFYVQVLENEDNPMWRNGQTYILGGSRTEEGLANIRKRVERGQLILLVTERFDESCIALERLFPEDFKDCSYVCFNISSNRETISKSQRRAVSQYMDFDAKLLTIANEYLDATLDRLFPDSNERKQYLNDFRKRCQTKVRKKRFINAFKSIERVIKIAAHNIIRSS